MQKYKKFNLIIINIINNTKKTCTFATMKEENKDITDTLCRITGIRETDARFGEPFIGAFSAFASQSHEEVLAASYICSLFLSAIFNKFPTEKLNAFVHYTKEHYKYFSFNCKMYDNIFAQMNENTLKSVPLFDKEGYSVLRHCSKQDIFEAFDFYTNI